MSPPIRNTIIRNTLYSILGRTWTIAVNIVLVPYIISKIGIDRFGIWALLSILVGYFALLDFGIGVSFTRFITEAFTKGDGDEINRIVNSGFVFYLLLALPVSLIAFFARGPIFSLLNIDPIAYPDAVTAYYGTLVIFLLSTALSGFSSVLLGLQRIALVNKIAIVVTIPNVVGTVVLLRSGLKLDGLMWTSLVSSVSGLLITFLYAKRNLASLRFNPFMFSSKTVKRLLGFGLKIQFAKFSDLITFQADKTIVSSFSGITVVGFYQIGSQIVWRIRDLPLLLLSSLLPAASELHTLNDRKKLLEMYARGTKYLAVVSIPLMFFLAATAHMIMRAWVGPGYDMSANISQILIAGYLCNVLVGVGAAAAAGMNQPDFQWHSAIVTTVANLVLVVILGYFFGIYGIAVASTLSLIVGPAYFLVKFHGHIQVPLRAFASSIMISPFLISLAGCSVLWVANTLFFGSANYGGRLPYLIILSVEAVIFAGTYGWGILRNRYFDEVDRELFVNNYLLTKVQKLVRFSS